MEFNLIEMITLGITLFLISAVFRLEQRVKALDYKVEQLSADTDMSDKDLYQELNQELKVLIHQGKEVKAVKRVRETKRLSLIEAKQYIDNLKLQDR